MVRKSIIAFVIIAALAFGTCACWGYTVSQWPPPGIPNTVYGSGAACLDTAAPGAVESGSFLPGNAGYGAYGGSGGYGYQGSYGGQGGGYSGPGWGR